MLELTLREEIDANEVIDVVRTDVGLTAKVLRLSNSAGEGARVAITSIDGAKRLGTRRLINLILTSCVGSYFSGMGASSLRSNRSLWEESVTNALACRVVARMQGSTDPNWPSPSGWCRTSATWCSTASLSANGTRSSVASTSG